jgi:hypothetical protein
MFPFLSMRARLSTCLFMGVVCAPGLAQSAGISQARNSHEAYGQEAGGYGKRYGAAMAKAASSQFSGTFVFSTIFIRIHDTFPWTTLLLCTE